MKTLNFYLFLLTALLCGAFFCTDSSARVCFATDPDCGSGGNFGNMDELKQNDCACIAMGYNCPNTSLSSCLKLNSKFEINDKIDWVIKGPISGKFPLSNSQSLTGGYTKIGLTTGTCTADSIKYKCPYNSACVKCCDKSFRYEGCIYPLEIAGKCGDRYKCQCPDEYAISSEYAETNNCQPGGGYCMLNDGTTDTVKYKTCTCDEDIYTDVGSCKNNQTETSSCKDAQGTVRKKCHCDRGVYPYAACEYGPSIGAKTCIDSNSNREYYSRCKTAEEACRTYDEDDRDDHDGKGGFQHNDCSRIHNCTTKEQVWNPDSKKYEYLTSYNCILGEQCPYPVNPGLYKCVFDKASWCMSHGYTSTMTTKPTNGAKCSTPDGFVGTYSLCPGNDNNSLFYYTCKLPCEQEVRRAFSKGYLTQDPLMVGDDGSVVGFIRTAEGSVRHLYLTGNITLPKTRISKNATWTNTGFSTYDYGSINGMHALADTGMKYPDGSYMFAGCADERRTYTRPVIKYDGMNIGANNSFIDKNMSDIVIDIYASNTSDGDGFGEVYFVTSPTWKNIKIKSYSIPWESRIKSVGNYYYLDSNISEIRLLKNNTLTLTGDVVFDVVRACYGKNGDCTGQNLDFYTGQPFYVMPFFFRIQESAVVQFKDAVIDTGVYYGMSWNGNTGSIHFYNTTMKDSYATVGDFWNSLNIGLSNSTIRASRVRTYGFSGWNTGRRFGGYSDLSGDENTGEKLARCKGIYLKDYSTLKMEEAGWIASGTKIYVDWGSTLEASRPIKMENFQHSLICLNYSKISINGKSFGTGSKSYVRHYSHGGWLGSDNSYENINSTGYPTGVWYYKYDKGNYDGNYPCSMSGKCDGKCNTDYDPKWNGSYLCTGCINCEAFGMGY